MKNKGYGLFTTIAMIVGIVIGSGIFFKSDNILVATGGNIVLGVLVFSIAAISIIFGSLTIGELAARNENGGGLLDYAEQACNKSVSCAFGWFQTFLYLPTLIAVVGYVSSIYICLLFGIEGTLNVQMLISLLVIVILFAFNMLSAKFGGIFQNASTIIKLIPLILIAILGVIYGNPSMESLTSTVDGYSTAGWITAIAPIAFAFDGWIVAVSIGDEVRDAKKNLPRALIFAPIFILIVYIIYFVGISLYVGPANIIAMGDAHVNFAAEGLFGSIGSKLILIFVIISILGTCNGLIIGIIRQPYLLSKKNMFPRENIFGQLNEKVGMPINSAVISFIITMFWLLVHYLTTKSGILGNSDVSEISVSMSYGLYILLYVKVFRMGLSKEIPGIFKGIICPILASIGALIILFGSMSNSLFWVYASICIIIFLSAMAYWKKKEKELAY